MFEELKGFVGDNQDALELIKKIETSSTDNVVKINTLERQVTDITTTRDKFKTGNTLVKSVLGLDSLNEETLTDAIKALKGSKGGDNASLAEIENLKNLLAAAGTETNTLKSGYESQISTMGLDNAIANSGVGIDIANAEMFGIVKDLVKQGASFEDGKVVYKNQDGTTLYHNGTTPLTISDRVNTLKNNPSYSGLFKPVGSGGSGAPAGNPAGGDGTLSRGGMSHSDKSKYITEHGNDAYLKLAK